MENLITVEWLKNELQSMIADGEIKSVKDFCLDYYDDKNIDARQDLFNRIIKNVYIEVVWLQTKYIRVSVWGDTFAKVKTKLYFIYHTLYNEFSFTAIKYMHNRQRYSTNELIGNMVNILNTIKTQAEEFRADLMVD